MIGGKKKLRRKSWLQTLQYNLGIAKRFGVAKILYNTICILLDIRTLNMRVNSTHTKKTINYIEKVYY